MKEFTEEDLWAGKKWELIVALASNPALLCYNGKESDDGEGFYLSPDQLEDNANQIINQAISIIDKLKEQPK